MKNVPDTETTPVNGPLAASISIGEERFQKMALAHDLKGEAYNDNVGRRSGRHHRCRPRHRPCDRRGAGARGSTGSRELFPQQGTSRGTGPAAAGAWLT